MGRIRLRNVVTELESFLLSPWTYLQLMLTFGLLISLIFADWIKIEKVSELYITFSITLLLALLHLGLIRSLFGFSKWMLTLVASFYLALYLMLSVFFVKTGHPLDYPLVVYNFTEIFNPEAVVSIFGNLSAVEFAFVGAGLTLLVGLSSWISFSQQGLRYPVFSSLVLIGLISSFVGAKVVHSCPVTFFVQTAFQQSPVSTSPYPYVRFSTASKASDSSKRDVFLIFVESFAHRFLNARDDRGRPFTPFLNKLAAENTLYSRFYSNSIQTSRSQFATLCGVPASFRRKVFTHHSKISLNCLPKVLSENGYQTLFFKAFHTLEFDNSEKFSRHIGFQYQKSMGEFTKPTDKEKIWGWGIQDDIFYRRFFKFADQQLDPQQPLFVVLTTVSNHMMFDQVPKEQRYHYPQPRTILENYGNSIRVTDEYLRTFFEELKKRPRFDDAIVIITGDNGYPLGEHGMIHNEAGAWEEFFRTPLIIYGLGKREVSTPKSHLNLGPSVLSWLGLSARNHFVAQHLEDEEEPIVFSQPYAGTLLGARYKDYKLIKNLTMGSEQYFLLEDKEVEIDQQRVPEAVRAALQAGVEHQLKNQFLIENDLIWPKDEQ